MRRATTLLAFGLFFCFVLLSFVSAGKDSKAEQAGREARAGAGGRERKRGGGRERLTGAFELFAVGWATAGYNCFSSQGER